jgi:hypothetical protein
MRDASGGIGADRVSKHQLVANFRIVIRNPTPLDRFLTLYYLMIVPACLELTPKNNIGYQVVQVRAFRPILDSLISTARLKAK